MPNTLAHLGVGRALTRLVAPDADPRWVYLGCLIPDLPWIAQRVVRGIDLPIGPYDMRTYAIGQACFASCLLMSAAFALISLRPGKTFLILAANSLVHLLLDGAQTKWGSGVHLLAPLSWWNWDGRLFWPESTLSFMLTALGMLAICVDIRHWRTMQTLPLRISRSAWGAGILLSCYLLLPLYMMPLVLQADCHFVRTLSDVDSRAGKYVELDRARLVESDHQSMIVIFTGEQIHLAESAPIRRGKISVRGRFTDSTTLEADAFHIHHRHARELTTWVGLFWLALIWCIPGIRMLKKDS